MVARFGAQKNLMYTSQNVLVVFVPAFELERKKSGSDTGTRRFPS